MLAEAWEKKFLDAMSAYNSHTSFEVQYWAKVRFRKGDCVADVIYSLALLTIQRSPDDILDDASSGDAILILVGVCVMIFVSGVVYFRPGLPKVGSRVFHACLVCSLKRTHIVFCCLLSRCGNEQSRAVAVSFGVFLVMLGVFAALGLSALFNIMFTPLHLQVLPFLALGLGVCWSLDPRHLFVPFVSHGPHLYNMST